MAKIVEIGCSPCRRCIVTVSSFTIAGLLASIVQAQNSYPEFQVTRR